MYDYWHGNVTGVMRCQVASGGERITPNTSCFQSLLWFDSIFSREHGTPDTQNEWSSVSVIAHAVLDCSSR